MHYSVSFLIIATSVVGSLVTPKLAPSGRHLQKRREPSNRYHVVHPPKPPHYEPPQSHWPPRPHWPDWKPFVTSDALQDEISTDELFKKAEILQNIAYATPDKNRAIGTLGHNNTVKYLTDYLSSKEMSSYYTFTTQGLPMSKADLASVTVNGVKIEAYAMTDAPNGNVTGKLYAVPNLACNASDFAAMPAGSIALVVRGTCDRGDKVILAGKAGASAVVYQNNVPGVNGSTLVDISLPHDNLPGDLIPSAFIPYDVGVALAARLASGEALTVYLQTHYTIQLTYNVIAETKGGDHDNVLVVCSHSDSVPAGPGINDNGSGSISILEVATQLTKFSVRNAVRFSWWTAEEVGLVGAAYYVSQLTAAEKAKIRLVLDYDMMASPNFAYQIYDGDGSLNNSTSPIGSAEAEHEFANFFDSKGLGHTEILFDGRSDYGPFRDNGIAAGGIACGAEGLKTAAEVELFGGQADVAYDVCYHSACDTTTNLNITAWGVMTDAIAHMTAVYARSWESLPTNATAVLEGRYVKSAEAERMEKMEAEKGALSWVTGSSVRKWMKKNERV